MPWFQGSPFSMFQSLLSQRNQVPFFCLHLPNDTHVLKLNFIQKIIAAIKSLLMNELQLDSYMTLYKHFALKDFTA